MPRFSLSSLALPALFAAALTAGCGGGGGDSPPPPAPTPPAPAPVPPPATPTAEVAVTVADTSGRFVDAATITVVSSGTTAATNAQGAATVRVPVGSEQVLRIAKAGSAEQVQLLRLEAGATQGFLRTMLVAREPAVAINAIEGGGSATGRDGVKVEFPPGALVNASGQAVTGRIDMVMTPLNTARADVRAFPGSFEGTAPGVARSPIVTFGTSELVPQQNGQKLNLAPNRSATIELPMYARTELDGTPIRPGDRIPLWSLNASTGLWVQEGEGTVIAQPASPTGLAMRASISHFSWWNVDRFAERGTVNVTVRVVGSNVPANTRAWLEAQVVSGNGPTSAATTSVTVGNATQLPVATPGTLRFTASFDTPTESCFGSTTASVARGVTTDVTVNMTCVTAPVPTIIEPSGLTSTNSSDPTRVQIQVDGRQPDQVQLLANGTAVATFGPQFFYVHQLNTASLPEGTVSLTARATLGTLNRTSPPVSLRIDRTAPTITGFTPATTTPVTRATQFVVDFSEPVNALPFTLADAVRLTVTLPGQSTPTPIAANVELNTAGTRLTVTPNAELTIGTVGLSWGGLRDAAGNNITGTLGASWPVARAQVFAADLASNITDGFGTQTGLATVLFRADGSLLAMHQPLPSNNVQLARFDRASNTWVTASPPANDRAVPTNVHIAVMALDGNDVPHVAFAQSRATDATRVELVLKRFVNGAWEALAPPLPLAGERLFDSTPGQLAFDAQGRPVVAFADPNLSQLQVLRLENGALVSIGDSRFVQLSADISLQRGPDGALWMSYTEGRFGANGSLLRVARFDGTWSNLPDVDSTLFGGLQFISSPRLTFVGTTPWIAYTRADGTGDGLRVLRLDGTSWVRVPFATPIAYGAGATEISVIDGQVVLVDYRRDNTTLVVRHDGTGWVDPFSVVVAPETRAVYRLLNRGDTTLLVSNDRVQRAVLIRRLTLR